MTFSHPQTSIDAHILMPTIGVTSFGQGLPTASHLSSDFYLELDPNLHEDGCETMSILGQGGRWWWLKQAGGLDAPFFHRLLYI